MLLINSGDYVYHKFECALNQTCLLAMEIMKKKFAMLHQLEILFYYVLLNKGEFVWNFQKIAE